MFNLYLITSSHRFHLEHPLCANSSAVTEAAVLHNTDKVTVLMELS